MSEPNAWTGVAGTAIGAVVGALGQSIAAILKNVWDERQDGSKIRKHGKIVAAQHGVKFSGSRQQLTRRDL